MHRFQRLINAVPIMAVGAIALYVGVNQWNKSDQAVGAAPQVSSTPSALEVSNTEWGTVESVSDGDTLRAYL
jgi:endonuclease YncB( thermonuclease family)